MLRWIAIVWVVGLFTIVPLGTYYLLFHAPRDQYALLMGLVLFWIFGFWGVIGPIVAAAKTYLLFRHLEHARREGRLDEVLQAKDTQDVAIELIASENKIPRFVAAWIYRLFMKKLPSLQSVSSDMSKSQRTTNVR